MKNIVLYLMLFIAIPASAQSGLFGNHSHHSRRHQAPMEHHHGSLMQHGPLDRRAPQGMNPVDFNVLVEQISQESFDKNRLSLAKRTIADNKMTTKQISLICSLFTFEVNRLDFAKFAYPFCVDQNMYFLIDQTFAYSSSKEELHKYINSHKK